MTEPTREPWQGRGSLTRRILAVNVVALVLIAGSLFYLDNFRVRLIEERRAQAEGEAQLAAAAINAAPRRARQALIATLAKRSGDRLRLYDDTGAQLLDSWATGPRTYGFDGRADEPWDTEGARYRRKGKGLARTRERYGRRDGRLTRLARARQNLDHYGSNSCEFGTYAIRAECGQRPRRDKAGPC
jgi:hypothetical protein